MKMDTDSLSLVLRALKVIEDVRPMAMEIAVNRADFLMMAYYLLELKPFLEELNKQHEFLLAKSTCPSLQRFTTVIEGMHTFTKVCSSQSRIYLLCHSFDVVHQMAKSFKQLAECLSAVLAESSELLPSSSVRMGNEFLMRLEALSFLRDPGHNKLAQEISKHLKGKEESHSMDIDEQQRQQMDLLEKIANHLKVDFSEVSVLQMELRKQLTTAESEGQEDVVLELKSLCALLCSPDVTDDRRIWPVSEPCSPHGGHIWEVPNSFLCPITKEVMREPVMLEQGCTYEKAAIVEWFQRGYRTCPVTGEELKTLELIPNVNLKMAMEEYFSNLQTQQLMHSLHELEKESTAAGIEARVSIIKSILGKNSGHIRLLVPLGGIGPLVSVLNKSSPQIREWVFRILYKVSLLGDTYKVSIIREKAIPIFIRILQMNSDHTGGPLQLLWELSKCEAALKAILAEQGAILHIATACNLCQNDQKLLAEKLLDNLCRYDQSVIIEAAKSNVFGPFISGLSSGDEDLKLKLAIAVCHSLELNEHTSSVLVKAGITAPLLHLFQFGKIENKQAAGKALLQLSTTGANAPYFANEGAIPVLVEMLDTSIPQLKVDALAILSNLAADAQVAAGIDQESTVAHHLGLLLEDPLMQEYSVKTLQCMAKGSQTVRKSLLNLVPNFYGLLKNEGLSSSCRGSVLSLLRFLAKDDDTRNALLTSADTITFLLTFMEKTSTAGEKEAILTLLAGLSKIEGMKSVMVKESHLLRSCLAHLKSQNSPNMQEAAAVILSQLCDPTLAQASTLVGLARQGLISNLMEISGCSTSRERAVFSAVATLGHLSNCSPSLTEHQSLLKRLLSWLGIKKYNICNVHSGKCSVKETLCIVEAGAVPLLINVIKEGSSHCAEQAVDALKTVVDHKENQDRGVDFLVSNGILPSLVSTVGKSSLYDEKAASLMEIIFRVKKFRNERFSKAATISLQRILGTGSPEARKAASKALMHLKKVARNSSYEPYTTTTYS